MVDFDEFLGAHFDALAWFPAVLTGDHTAAHELVADTLLAVSTRRDRIAAMEHRPAHVRSVLVSTFVNQRRDRRRLTIAKDRTGP